MASKVFLDASCILDLTLQRAGFQQAGNIIQLAIIGDIKLYTTTAVLHITAYYTSFGLQKPACKNGYLNLAQRCADN